MTEGFKSALPARDYINGGCYSVVEDWKYRTKRAWKYMEHTEFPVPPGRGRITLKPFGWQVRKQPWPYLYPKPHVSSSLRITRVPHYFGHVKRDPNVENCPESLQNPSSLVHCRWSVVPSPPIAAIATIASTEAIIPYCSHGSCVCRCCCFFCLQITTFNLLM